MAVEIPFINTGRLLLRVDGVLCAHLRNDLTRFSSGDRYRSSGDRYRYFIDVMYLNGAKTDIEFKTEAEQLAFWRLLRITAGAKVGVDEP